MRTMNNVSKFVSVSLSVLVAGLLSTFIVGNSLSLFNKAASDGFGSVSSNASPGARSDFQLDANGNDLGGTSVLSSSTVIKWRSEFYTNSQGATVIEIVKAAADRMQRLQRTPQASDTNARALWELRKAIDIMEGKDSLPVSPLEDAQ